jgi:aryl-alcohol dehydrogenase-like predicted oxidoreductase
MEYRSLGKTGPRVSCVGLGCNNFGGRLDLEGTRAVVHKALDLGITLFDTADSYGGKGASEEYLGKILGARRSEVVLATKFGWPMDKEEKLKGASRRYIMSAVEASLKRLQTDCIDLYQQHVPDPQTPIDETLRALDDLVKQGKVRTIGCSNFSAAQVDEAAAVSKGQGFPSFVSCQSQYSLLARDVEKDLLAALERNGMGFIPFSPLGGGMLTGKYKPGAPLPAGTRLTDNRQNRFLNDANWKILEKLMAFCEQRKRGVLELAFSWLLAHPVVSSVIAGAMTPDQVQKNVDSAGWKLTAAEMAEIDGLARKA